MNAKNLLVLVLVSVVLFSCETTESKKEAASEAPVTLATLLTDDACFDERMEKWFVEFNQLQNKGLDMDQANTEAIALVSEVKNCDSEQKVRTANLEGVSEE